MTRGLGANNPFGAVVNNTGLDPFQGFDVEVWATDLSTGRILDIGQFQSCTFTVRNATETYLPLGQRIPSYYDGEMQIAWVLERGKLNTDYLDAWFGTNDINKDRYLSRGPRFQITIDYNAVELQAGGVNTTTYVVNSSERKSSRGLFDPKTASNSSAQYLIDPNNVNARGRLNLVKCKVDSMSEGIMPGRRIIANRWEGVAEGIFYEQGSVQIQKEQFRSNRFNANSNSIIQNGVDANNSITG
jgi:hypothetical protein